MLTNFSRKRRERPTSFLTQSDGAAFDLFGSSVALSGDANTIIIGAPSHTANGHSAEGSATVFTRSGSTWTQQQIITQSDGLANDNFGRSVAISNDGNTVAIGEKWVNGTGRSPAITGINNRGRVVVFTRSGSTWTQQQALNASSGYSLEFGMSVALSADGNTLIAGSSDRFYTSTMTGYRGRAEIFIRSGSTWTLESNLTTDAVYGDQFGASVALSSDGNTAIVGVRIDHASVNSQGSAIVFTRSGGTWTQQQKITQSDGGMNEYGTIYFGWSVALSADGNTALVGARDNTVGSNNGQGSATVFTRSGGVWTQQQTITQSDGGGSDAFGYSVALSSDGNTAIVSAPGDDVGGGYGQGSATVFTRAGSVWTQQQTFTQTGGVSGDTFGYKVSLSSSGYTKLVGAYLDNVGANTDQGSATIFEKR